MRHIHSSGLVILRMHSKNSAAILCTMRRECIPFSDNMLRRSRRDARMHQAMAMQALSYSLAWLLLFLCSLDDMALRHSY